jgi:hypothetical protein
MFNTDMNFHLSGIGVRNLENILQSIVFSIEISNYYREGSTHKNPIPRYLSRIYCSKETPLYLDIFIKN